MGSEAVEGVPNGSTKLRKMSFQGFSMSINCLPLHFPDGVANEDPFAECTSGKSTIFKRMLLFLRPGKSKSELIRIDLERQLSERPCECVTLWGSQGLLNIYNILNSIQSTLWWPTSNFIPDDPLVLCLWPPFDHDCIGWAVDGINDAVKLNVEKSSDHPRYIDSERIISMCLDGNTIGDLYDYLSLSRPGGQ